MLKGTPIPSVKDLTSPQALRQLNDALIGMWYAINKRPKESEFKVDVPETHTLVTLPSGIKMYSAAQTIAAASSITHNYPTGTFVQRTSVPNICIYCPDNDSVNYSIGGDATGKGITVKDWGLSGLTIANWHDTKQAIALITVFGR